MAHTETTIPVETLAGLDFEEGDILTVAHKGQGSVTLTTETQPENPQMTGARFVRKWSGAFNAADLEEKSKIDPRLAHIIKKHMR